MSKHRTTCEVDTSRTTTTTPLPFVKLAGRWCLASQTGRDLTGASPTIMKCPAYPLGPRPRYAFAERALSNQLSPACRGRTAEPTSVQNRVSGTNRCLFPDIRHLGLDPATAPGHVTSSYVRSSPTSKSNVLLSDGPLAHYVRSRQVTLDPVPPAASNVLLSDGPRQVSSSYVRSSPASNVPPLRWATSGLVKLR